LGCPNKSGEIQEDTVSLHLNFMIHRIGHVHIAPSSLDPPF
jgi:hypothetical protein